jgi:murein L,D-transpeptidase YcbB/YkuD
MSKRIVFPLLVCMLTGACALDTPLVAAQAVGGQSPRVANPPAGDSSGAATAPVLASLRAESPQDQNAPDDIEPDLPAQPPEGLPPADAVAVPLPLPPCPTPAGGVESRVADRICQRIRIEPRPARLSVQNHAVRQVEHLVSFYARHGYRPAWLDSDGTPSAAAGVLLKAVGDADREGLRAADYNRGHLLKLHAALQQGGAVADAERLADFDVLFTDTYLTYAAHLLAGRLPPRKVDPEWAIKPRSRDLAEVLSEALSGIGIAESLRGLAPKGKGYAQLRDVLQRYRKVEQEGGWPTVSGALGPGAQGAQSRNLRVRLQASGDLAEGDAGKNPVYDQAVADAVRRFQKRHGLAETGSVNASTAAALNVPVSRRIRQVELNMERWRWLPDEFGSRYILVNIPSFKMNVVENGKRVMESKVVVGRLERQTPTFTANMAYLVMSPKWYVPRSIALKDKLPQLKRNPNALARQNIRIFNSAGQQINPGAVNWKAVGEGNFNYQLRQDAGPRNALGGIKFMFPNPYNVYLHDTPTRGLFAQNTRTFSSGCIRISNPVELAEYLLKHDPKWNRNAIKAAAASGKQRVVNLPQQVPVYLLYWTAWVDEDGLANFRDDIYSRDKPLVRALYQEAGGPANNGA